MGLRVADGRPRLTLRSIEIKTKTVVGLKIINLEDADDEMEDIQQEIAILAQVRAHASSLRVIFIFIPSFWIFHLVFAGSAALAVAGSRVGLSTACSS